MVQLPTAPLGKDGPLVDRLGFGTMGLSNAYGAVGSIPERLDFLDKLYESGSRFWDTADIYADSEDLIGQWFARSGKRKDIFLATKFAGQVIDGAFVVRSDPEYAKQALDKSLERLGVDKIDLYYVHRLDDKTPIEKTIEALVEAKKAGKISYIGLSEVSSRTLERAHAVHPISCVQMEYSPFALDIETEGLLATCRRLGVAVVAYSPLGRGFLTGAYKSPDDFEEGDFRKISPRFSKENFPANLKLVEKLEALAKRKGCTSGQLSLAWLMDQGLDVFPIPGTKKVKYLEENLDAVNVKLTKDEDKEIRDAVEGVSGARYPDWAAKSLFADTPEL
ncbi:MAG: hypothetical protein M1814_004201 [Vezdaea aestivalis]|nr:MAG: hypothetical protein M1814_004201 [Vezdaea aestivalis]